jgi:signal transduction histidine kinase
MAPAALAAAALLACALASAAALRARARRAREGVPRDAAALLSALSGALGDAVLAFDARGRLTHANEAGRALVVDRGAPGGGRDHDLLGEDVAVLLRGLARGPAAGRVEVVAPAGKRGALAAAVRLAGPPRLDVLVLRLAPPAPSAASPPAMAPPIPTPPAVEQVDEADILDDPSPRPVPLATAAAALAAELRVPLARAGAAVALLRLSLPRGQAVADEQLGRAEEELRIIEVALAALGEPLAPSAPGPVDLAALAAEAAADARFAPGVRVRSVGAGVAALADAAQLREALHRLLVLAARAMPQGGELGLRTLRREREAILEIADSGPAADGGLELALAERLVAAQGGRVERAPVPGRGTLVRVALPAAPAAATARRPRATHG